MTSEGEARKTNEFLRRRKLRLQQVREQSKDIAKLIRQRATVEKLKEVVELDTSKEKAFFQRQENVVKKLEELYSKALENVGTSHRGACEEVLESDHVLKKTDLAQLRGKEATAELRRKKQQKLNEQKKSLDRKVQAREAANVISREKSSSVANKLSTKSSIDKFGDEGKSGSKSTSADKLISDNLIIHCESENKDCNDKVTRNDMATQWDTELFPCGWEPSVPVLPIPRQDSTKDSVSTETEKQKRNLFALSDEMPSSLRGIQHNDNESSKPSLTLVTEYIQNRALRLREPEVINCRKKQSEDLHSIKQTIVRSRPTNPQGSAFSNICHVLEGQVIPVPTWHAETCRQHCNTIISRHEQHPTGKRQFTNFTNSQINKIFSSIRPGLTNSGVIPTKRRFMSFIHNKLNKYCPACELSAKAYTAERLFKENDAGNGALKKKCVTLYNHSTKDTRHVPFNDEPVVVRDMHSNKDAYSEARSETAVSNNQEKEKKKIIDMTNKIAMSRHHVEKEYKDTMAFLNGLPKNKSCKPISKAYKDEHRLQMQSENRQRILQEEFRKVEKYSNIEKGCASKSALSSSSRPIRCKSPLSSNDENFKDRDFQYSWMPVPEGDGNLVVHTIPTAMKEGKTGSSVKFSKIDSYHEYRSRHKHTPPTKDTGNHDKKHKRYVETVIVQQKEDNSLSASSVTSDNGSTEDIRLDSNENRNTYSNNDSIRELTDAERIIIYKILDYKKKKRDKSSKKFPTVNAQSSSDVDNGKKNKTAHTDLETRMKQQNENDSFLTANTAAKAFTFGDLDEGIYKKDGAKEDNMTSTYYADSLKEDGKNMKMDKSKKSSSCKASSERQSGEGQQCGGDGSKDHQKARKRCSRCVCVDKPSSPTPDLNSCLITSTTSFKTAVNVKLDSNQADGEFVKLIDEGGEEKGNIYIGATGLLRDDAYEVVIQLRKRGTKDSDRNTEDVVNSPVLEVHQTDNIEKELVSSAEPTDPNTKDGEHYSEVVDYPQTTQINEDPVIISNRRPKPEHKEYIEHPNCSKNNDTLPSDQLAHDNVPNTTPSPRPATSVYTQTTCGSPNLRPVLVHMSSSTSTAYMSPPEVILPKYLRRPHESPDKTCQNVNRYEMYEQHPYCEKNKCVYRRCTRYTKSYLRKIHSVEKNRLKTPPNTARSIETEVEYNSVNGNDMKKVSTHPSPFSSFRCDKSKGKVNSKLHRNCNYKKIQPQALGKRGTKTPVLFSKKRKVNSSTCKKASKSYLHPMIKDYIKKLLSLNQEGIRAIQVMDQECSSVNTPADSILNIHSNVRRNEPVNSMLSGKISLEQIRNILIKHFFKDGIYLKLGKRTSSGDFSLEHVIPKHKSLRPKSKKRKVHKVKTLNISKKIRMSSYDSNFNESSICFPNSEKSTLNVDINARSDNLQPTETNESNERLISKERICKKISSYAKKHSITKVLQASKSRNKILCDVYSSGPPKTVVTSGSTSPDGHIVNTFSRNQSRHPINSSTQTIRTIDTEINFMKLAEDKLQNMEKIANLTEKCSKRLSNLAKVLEEVRKNKSLVYSPISNSDSTDFDTKSDKPLVADKFAVKQSPRSMVERKEKPDLMSPSTSSKNGTELDSTDYEALLFSIPKATNVEIPDSMDSDDVNDTSKALPSGTPNSDYRINNTKFRSKPPPALLRIHMKRTQETVIPHELSTVIEVDSPMSVKLKNQSSNLDNTQSKNLLESKIVETTIRDDIPNEHQINTVIRQSNLGLVNNSDAVKIMSTDTSDDSKLRMMDLNQFNEIMLRPFISLREYAQEYCADDVNAKFKRDIHSKGKIITEDVSSLHSDGSLPDVVAELLKRKLITEPFKFDSASNVNSTTVSSASTSLMALSKARDDTRRQKKIENKENLTETSDTLSISSNPDLENAFKKLGMGWASSTLKKTKERLALSSSSNTSSSSLSQFKFKNSSKQDILTDSVSSVPNLPIKSPPQRCTEISKNVEQQTSITNSMTVKEFLTKELAKKITFTNKSSRNETTEEFMSLLETKLPDELKSSPQAVVEDNSGDTVPSGSNNRARTSTPVHVFKSVTYHSSSSSNISNGLFSNADELSSVKLTSTSMRHHSTSEKDELTIPNLSLKMRKDLSDCSKTDSY